MRYGRYFSHAWQIIWQSKWSGLLGLLASVGNLPSLYGRIYLLQTPTFLNTLASTSFENSLDKANHLLWVWIYAMPLFLFLWVLATWGEAALIFLAFAKPPDSTTSLKGVLNQGRRILPRLIGIDTLVFLPLFVITMGLLLLFLGTLVAVLVGLTQQPANSKTMWMALLPFCLCLLFAILPPFTIGTLVFRTLAFRDTAVHEQGIRATVRQTWQTLKRLPIPIFIMTVLIGGLQLVWGLLMSVIQFFATTLMGFWGISTNSGWGLWLIIVFVVIAFGLTAVIHAYTATLWTLFYKETLSS